jgi:hypothetical protein
VIEPDLLVSLGRFVLLALAVLDRGKDYEINENIYKEYAYYIKYKYRSDYIYCSPEGCRHLSRG